MQPPGGPPHDKRKALPPPWGHPPREPTAVQPPGKPAAPAAAPPTPAVAPTPTPTPAPAPAPASVATPSQAAAPVQPLSPMQTQPYPQTTRPPARVASPHKTPGPERLPKPPMPGPPQVAAPAPIPAPAPSPPMPTPTPGALPLTAPPEPPTLEDSISLAPSRGIVDLIKVSARRAFRVRPDPAEVLKQERTVLATAQPPIVDATMQGFLAWRRSVLLVVATLLVPLVVLRFVEVGGADTPDSLTGLRSMTVLVEAGFAVLAWIQLRNWTQWYRQRRTLAWGVAVWFVAPFALALVPLRETFDRSSEMVGVYVGLQAMLTLAPRALAVAPATIRAALVNQHLFPDLALPGKLIAIAAAVGALIAYLVLILPYQVTGSGWFVVAIAEAIAAQVFLLRGRRRDHLIASGVAALFAVIGFARMVSTLEMSGLAVVNLVLSFAVGVLAGTLVATDALMTALDRGDGPRAAPPPAP